MSSKTKSSGVRAATCNAISPFKARQSLWSDFHALDQDVEVGLGVIHEQHAAVGEKLHCLRSEVSLGNPQIFQRFVNGLLKVRPADLR